MSTSQATTGGKRIIFQRQTQYVVVEVAQHTQNLQKYSLYDQIAVEDLIAQFARLQEQVVQMQGQQDKLSVSVEQRLGGLEEAQLKQQQFNREIEHQSRDLTESTLALKEGQMELVDAMTVLKRRFESVEGSVGTLSAVTTETQNVTDKLEARHGRVAKSLDSIKKEEENLAKRIQDCHDDCRMELSQMVGRLELLEAAVTRDRQQSQQEREDFAKRGDFEDLKRKLSVVQVYTSTSKAERNDPVPGHQKFNEENRHAWICVCRYAIPPQPGRCCEGCGRRRPKR